MKRSEKVSFTKRYFALSMISLFCLGAPLLAATGFYINETFRGSKSTQITLGGSPKKAFLTVDSLIDTDGNGWLRLTNDEKEQKGFAIVNQPFSSTNGVLVDMEFVIWRTHSDGYGGADGFSIFLYDATVSPFAMGGFGGSLGYAQRKIEGSSVLEPGLTGGYVGIGFDEYGNFSRYNEDRNGGIAGDKTPNTIGIRGPEVKNSPTTTYNWLTGNSNLGFNLQAGQVNSRPADGTYYRRVQLEITPVNGKYSITIRMMTTKGGIFNKVLGPYELPTLPPASLKLGMAASTGSSINIHELRNLIITSAGGIRTNKSVNKTAAKIGDELTYTIDVFNQTDKAATGLKLNEQLAQISQFFKVTDVQFYDHGDAGNTASNYSNYSDLSNISLNLSPISYGTFVIKGNITSYPTGGILTNSATVDLGSSGITDPDLVNNTSSATTTVELANAPDFTISQTVDKVCLDPVNFNTIALKVTNSGKSESVLGSVVTVKDTIPNGLQVVAALGEGWTTTNVGNAYTFTRSDVLAKNTSFPNINIVVKQIGTTPNISWNNVGWVRNDSDHVSSNNFTSPLVLYSPAEVNAGPDQTVYASGVVTLAGNAPGALTGTWTVVSGQATIANPNLPNTTVTLQPNTTAKLRWTLSNTGCSSYDEVNVSYYLPKITVIKSVSNAQTFKLGSNIVYSFAVSNAGLATLTDVVLTDNLLPVQPLYVSGDVNTNNKLDIGETWIYSGNYTIKQSDVDAGAVRNSATATAKDPLLGTVSDISGSSAANDLPTSTPVEHINKVTLSKTVTTKSPYKLNSLIRYSFLVKNEGTTTLDSVRLIDNKLVDQPVYLGGDSIGGVNGKLDVNETWRYAGVYTVKQADVDFGKVSNIATVYCRDFNKTEVKDISGNNVPTVAFIDEGKITLVKAVDATKHKLPFAKGDTIDYKFTVKNIGNVPLDTITLTDLKYALINLKQNRASLQPDSIRTYKASYVVTQEDVDAGKVVNSALVSSSYSSGSKHASDLSGTTADTDDPTITPIKQVKSVLLEKKVDAVAGTSFKLGDKINYTLTAVNTGTVTLNPPVVTDDYLDNKLITYVSGDDYNKNKFDPGERWIHSGVHTVTQADLTAGKVTNIGYLSALDPQGIALKDTSDVINTTIDIGPIAKDDEDQTEEGTPVTISVLDNDGKGITDLDNSTVQFQIDPNNPVHGTLAVSNGAIVYTPTPGFTGTITFTYIVRDLNGNISNSATVTVVVKASVGLVIPNVFTPNGDGINDEFVIKGLNAYDKARLVVFNRWGGEFYSNDDYKNGRKWNGYGLNDGTYYYVLYLTTGTKVSQRSGWVLIKR